MREERGPEWRSQTTFDLHALELFYIICVVIFLKKIDYQQSFLHHARQLPALWLLGRRSAGRPCFTSLHFAFFLSTFALSSLTAVIQSLFGIFSPFSCGRDEIEGGRKLEWHFSASIIRSIKSLGCFERLPALLALLPSIHSTHPRVCVVVTTPFSVILPPQHRGENRVIHDRVLFAHLFPSFILSYRWTKLISLRNQTFIGAKRVNAVKAGCHF